VCDMNGTQESRSSVRVLLQDGGAPASCHVCVCVCERKKKRKREREMECFTQLSYNSTHTATNIPPMEEMVQDVT